MQRCLRGNHDSTKPRWYDAGVVGDFQFTGARQRRLIVCLVACSAAFTLSLAHGAPRATDKEIIDSPLNKPAPEYPERALNANVEGSVHIAVTVGLDGRVAKAEVISAVPEGWFEKAALEAVKKWKYRSPRTEITFEVVIDFALPLP